VIALNLKDLEVDCLLISGLPNVRYLSGFTGSNGLLLLSHEQPILFTDSRYQIQAAQETKGEAKVHLVRSGPLSHAAAKVLAKKH
jgi:Xaa-Pro aminopeptidase